MAWTQQSKNGKSYRGLYRDRTGKTRSAGTFDSRSVALAAAKELEPATIPTFREWWETFEPTWPVSPGTKEIEKRRVEKHTLPRWGDVGIDKVTRAQVQTWINGLDLSASSKRKVLSIMSTAMQSAFENDLIASNPCRGIRKPKLPPPADRYLTDDECTVIRSALTGDLRVVFDLLLWTGMRFGEATGLHGSQVRDGVIEVRWSWDRVDRKFKAPKSGKSRSVPIPEKLVVPSAGKNELPQDLYSGGKKPNLGLVTGERVSYQRWRRGWDVATADLGGVRTHDLRHTYASRLVAAGVDMREVQRILGHASIVQTEHYSQFAPNSFAATRDALNRM